MKNRILVFSDVKKSEILEVETKSVAADEVLIKIDSCGLCTWERHIYSGKEPAGFPFHGGHEIAGTVVEFGKNVTGLTVGAPAAVVSWKRCNACDPCRKGFDNHCESMSGDLPQGTLWGPGGFAEYIVVKNYEVFPLGNKVPLHYGTLAEPLSCVTRGVKRSHIKTGDTAVVVGAGIMGLLFMKVLQYRGVQVIVAEIDAKRRNLASTMGAEYTINPAEVDWQEQIMKITKGKGAETVFYTAGGGEMINNCMKVTAIGGSVVIYAPIHSTKTVLESDIIHYNELNIIGTIRHDKESVFEAVRILGSGKLDLTGLNLVNGNLYDIVAEMEKADNDLDIHRILLKP
ncbi:MAG: alcohol dehydrogenase catalytic domain-containing protein [Clostridia bacterium]